VRLLKRCGNLDPVPVWEIAEKHWIFLHDNQPFDRMARHRFDRPVGDAADGEYPCGVWVEEHGQVGTRQGFVWVWIGRDQATIGKDRGRWPVADLEALNPCFTPGTQLSGIVGPVPTGTGQRVCRYRRQEGPCDHDDESDHPASAPHDGSGHDRKTEAQSHCRAESHQDHAEQSATGECPCRFDRVGLASARRTERAGEDRECQTAGKGGGHDGRDPQPGGAGGGEGLSGRGADQRRRGPEEHHADTGDGEHDHRQDPCEPL